MIKIIYKGKDLTKREKDIQKTFDSVKKVFSVEISDVTVRVYENRAEFNKQLKKETADWLVANASNNGEIDILSPIAMEKESSHNKNEFLQILKHEFTHLFANKLAKGHAIPKWLNEGLAAYIAKQHQNDPKVIYIEKKFCKKLGTPSGWNDNVNYFAYDTAAYFVYFLIKKYSFKKIVKLIVSLDKNYYYDSFKEIFFKIYNKNLKEVESLFIEEINK